MSKLLLQGDKINYSYFIEFSRNEKSQGGEDGVLEKIFELLGVLETREGERTSVCVDVGAWDGIHLSNSYVLLNKRKWNGVLIEANDERHRDLTKLYSHRSTSEVKCIKSHINVVDYKRKKLNNQNNDGNLRYILEQNNIPSDFEFISIDIDGGDFHVWEQLCRQPIEIDQPEPNDIASSLPYFHPKVVCIEFNPTIPNNVYFVQECDTRVHQGNSLLALMELGKELSYVCVATTTFNAIFVDAKLYEKYIFPVLMEFNKNYNYNTEYIDACNYPEAASNASRYNKPLIDILHPPASMYTYIFQTYDGELKFTGSKKLIWHKLAMNSQKLQVLPKKQRKFPYEPPWDVEIYNLTEATKMLLKYWMDIKVFISVWHQGHSECASAHFTEIDALRLNKLCVDCMHEFGRVVEYIEVLLPINTLQGVVMDLVTLIITNVIYSGPKTIDVCLPGNGNNHNYNGSSFGMNSWNLMEFDVILRSKCFSIWCYVLCEITRILLARGASYFGNPTSYQPVPNRTSHLGDEKCERKRNHMSPEDMLSAVYWYKIVFMMHSQCLPGTSCGGMVGNNHAECTISREMCMESLQTDCVNVVESKNIRNYSSVFSFPSHSLLLGILSLDCFYHVAHKLSECYSYLGKRSQGVDGHIQHICFDNNSFLLESQFYLHMSEHNDTRRTSMKAVDIFSDNFSVVCGVDMPDEMRNLYSINDSH